MKRFVLAALVCSLLAGCKYDLSFNTDSAKKVNNIDNYKCVQYLPKQGEELYFSLDRETGRFVDDDNDNEILKNTDNVWSAKRAGEEFTVLEQGNIASLHIGFPDTSRASSYLFSCHKEKAIN